MKRIVVVVASLFLLTGASRTDWKYFSTVTNRGGTGDVNSFYDEAGIRRLANGNLQFWTKELESTETDKVKADRALIDMTVNRIRNRYRPPILAIKDLNKNDLMEVLILEAVADENAIQPVRQGFWEVDCAQETSRIVSSIANDPVKGLKANNASTEWMHYPPESTGYGLIRLVCRK